MCNRFEGKKINKKKIRNMQTAFSQNLSKMKWFIKYIYIKKKELISMRNSFAMHIKFFGMLKSFCV